MQIKIIKSLAGKVILLVAGLGIILVGIITYSYTFSSGLALKNAEERYRNLTILLSSQLLIDLIAVTEDVNMIADFVQTEDPGNEILDNLLKSLVGTNKRIYGSTVAYEPYAFSTDKKYYAPYYYKSNGQLKRTELDKPDYNYFKKAWYVQPRSTLQPGWSPPYFDEGGGNTLMVTYSSPFFFPAKKGHKRFRGVVTADISVDWLTKRISDFRKGQDGFCFLVSDKGNFLSKHENLYYSGQSLLDLSKKMKSPEIARLLDQILSQPSGFLYIGQSLTSHKSYLAFSKIPENGWVLGLVIPRSDILDPVIQLYKTQVMVIAGLVVSVIVLILFVANSITKPLREMVKVAKVISQGNLDVKLPAINTGDEVEELSKAFNNMTYSLKDYIRELTETTAVKERMKSELEVAARIQQSMIPSKFPAYPDRTDFDIYAVMSPAKEVGGDLYDFFFLDEHRICIAVGDVSNKGVPAALYMAVTIFLIQAAGAKGRTPDEIMSILNEQIYKGNESCMFVTLFCGILDLRDGELNFSVAGHQPPLIVESDHPVMEIPAKISPALGIIHDAEYITETFKLEPGQTVLVFTDGVTETMNTKQEMYGLQRLKETILISYKENPDEIIKYILDDLDGYKSEADKFDDLTILAFTFKGIT